MAAGDFLSGNYGYDMSDVSYTGLTDTASAYTGSTTMQDVQLGAPLVLDTSYGGTDTSVTDYLNPDTDFIQAGLDLPASTQSLTGASEVPTSEDSWSASTPTPNSGQMSNSSWGGITALSKLGASLASLFGGQPQTLSGSAYRTVNGKPVLMSAAGGIVPPVAMSGSMTLVLVIVVGALILLLARSEG